MYAKPPIRPLHLLAHLWSVAEGRAYICAHCSQRLPSKKQEKAATCSEGHGISVIKTYFGVRFKTANYCTHNVTRRRRRSKQLRNGRSCASRVRAKYCTDKTRASVDKSDQERHDEFGCDVLVGVVVCGIPQY
mmetsp:Transcript_65120/g.171176  ORF Transcript_65120/g.171176 Transcript_65120/m.171176 type:complete len:133 (-) Transcript_65120:464-862(-)